MEAQGLSTKGLTADKQGLLEPFAFFPPRNRHCIPVTASSSVNSTAPVLSANGEVGQTHFPLSAPQAELDNIHRARFPFPQVLLPRHQLAGPSPGLGQESCAGVSAAGVFPQSSRNPESQGNPSRPPSPAPVGS